MIDYKFTVFSTEDNDLESYRNQKDLARTKPKKNPGAIKQPGFFS
jgi:hypothetical protein